MKSQPIRSLVLLMAAVFLFTSCEKVIDIDLDKVEKKYVVDATLSDQPGSARITITKTKDFDQDNVFEGISDAAVTILDQNGIRYDLTEMSQGIYSHQTLAAVSGNTYTLRIEVEGEFFTATSYTPNPTEIDTVTITDETIFGETRKLATIYFKDPPGRGNYYRFTQAINGIRTNQIMIMNDDYSDGRVVSSRLYYFADEEEDEAVIKSGDQVKINLHTINSDAYMYWFSLSKGSTGNGQQGTPANPVSNMRGGALGYFSTYIERSRTVVAP